MKSHLLSLACIVVFTDNAIAEKISDENTNVRQNLIESIHSYIPRSEVINTASFDLDLHAIKEELGKQNEQGWTNAMSIYEQGAFSKPIATITLAEPLLESIASGTSVTGISMNGTEIVGTTVGKTLANETSLRIAYDIDITKEDHVHCSVGGNPTPIFDGCLQAKGNLTLDNSNQTLFYSYNMTESNHNDHTLVELSTHAQSRMWTCSHCPFEVFKTFYNYYGEFDYADRIIQYAFQGQEMELDHGNMDFGYYTKYGRKVFISKAISYLSIWMYTIRQMEQAIADCEKGEFLQAVHFWDQAVALYTGSRGIKEGNNGDLLLHQADLRCQEFHTCGEWSEDGEGKSYVNMHVFDQFEQAQYNLLHNRCEKARESKDEIVRLMTIPLIQATLRYAHIIDHETYFNEKHGAQASLWALSILPLVHDCSPQDASTLYNQLKSKQTANVNFETVRAALENTYQCLNIQCAEIGGIWDDSIGNYKSDAYPCPRRSAEEGSNFLSAVLGGTFAGLICLGALGFWTWRQRQLEERAREEDENHHNWLADEELTFHDEPSHHHHTQYFDNPAEPPKTKKGRIKMTSKRLRDMLKNMG